MFFAVKSIAAPHACQRDSITTSQQAIEPDLSDLIAALSETTTNQSSRFDALERAIKTPPRTQAEMLLQDRARLQLAGMEIRRQQFDAARKRLLLVSTESPVAVQAGLLIAESWRLQGDNEASVQWFLRIGRRFADDINALQGLLAAAESLEKTNHPRQAAALYGEVTEKAMATVKQLESLPDNRDTRLDAVLSRQHPLPTALRRQLTSSMIREAPAFSQTRQIHREASREWQCLLLQQQQLEIQSERIQQHNSRLAQASILADESMSALNEEISLLETQVISGNFSGPQISIRKRLAQARNDKTHLKAQQEFITRTRHMLPETLADTEEKLQLMTRSFSEIHQQTSEDLYKTLEKSVAEVTATFRNIAGESQRRLAELQMQKSQLH